MKKFLALLLAFVMVRSLVACGSKGGDKPAADNSGTQNNTGSATTEQSVGKDGFTALKVDKKDRVSDVEITDLKTDKDAYAIGEPIAVIVSWKGTPYEDAWLGIIPADTPHGNEEVNDDADVDYHYLSEGNSGDTFIFEISLEPGKYTVRVNENDGGGVELAWCAFTVKDGSAPAVPEKPQTPEETETPENGQAPESWLATKTGKFYGNYTNGACMVYEMTMEGMTVKVTTATKGDKTYSCTDTEGMGQSVTVMDGEDLYLIDHASKTVLKMPMNMSGAEIANTFLDESDVDPAALVSGTREIDGKTYDTEEWIIDDAKSILCFDGDDLAYIVGEYEGIEVVMKVVEFSDKVDEALFEIPTDYELISY